MTHYQILGVDENASYSEIKHAYRRLVKQYHPDLNPSEEAKELIVGITVAYEVLSDPNKKSSYDWSLSGYTATTTVHYEPPIMDDREIRRKEYIRKKRAQEQENWRKLFKAKVKFYKYQRYFAFLFITISIIYSVDYAIKPPSGPYPVQNIHPTAYGKAGGRFAGMNFKTDLNLAYEYKDLAIKEAYLHHSGVFKIPVGISLDKENYYQFDHTFHIFNNFFSYLLMTFAFILLYNKKYSDWSLTVGLLPFFVSLFLILVTHAAINGVHF